MTKTVYLISQLAHAQFLILFIMASLLTHRFYYLAKGYSNGAKRLRYKLAWMFFSTAIVFLLSYLKTNTAGMYFYRYLVSTILIIGVIPFFAEVN